MKIIITGFFGERNLGDEAILSALLSCLGSSHKLALTCGRFPSVSGPEMIARRGLRAWPQYLAALKQADRVIFSGGILQDWSFEGITFFALRLLAASIFSAEPSLWGAGLGPIRKLAARRIARKALSRVRVAWLRDRGSRDLFTELTDNPACLGTDWSWSFPVEPSALAYANAPLAVNLRPWPFSEWQSHVEAQQKHIDRQVIGVPARPSDIAVIKQFFQAATVFSPESFADAGRQCQRFSYAIAMRYHIALVMLRSGLPVKLIAYDDKVANLAKEAGVTLLSDNRVSDFRQAHSGFFTDNESRFAEMRREFTRYFAC